MSEHDVQPAAGTAGHLEPRHLTGRLAAGRALAVQVQAAVGSAEAQAREAVDDEAQAVNAHEILRPAARLVAVHLFHEFLQLCSAQHGLDLGGAGPCLRQVPLRRQAGMNQGVAQRCVMVQQRAAHQPVDQFIPVRRCQHGIQCVVVMVGRMSVCKGEQVQVVVAEHGDRGIPEPPYEAQRFQ